MSTLKNAIIGTIVLAALLGAATVFIETSPLGKPQFFDISVEASWYVKCKQSYVRQSVRLTNVSNTELCFEPQVCGSQMLLSVTDDRGQRVTYGLSCGRTTDAIGSFLSNLRQLNPGQAQVFEYESEATTGYELDAPDEPLSPKRNYRGATAITFAECRQIRSVCPGTKCSWKNLDLKTQRVTLVPVPFHGEHCSNEER